MKYLIYALIAAVTIVLLFYRCPLYLDPGPMQVLIDGKCVKGCE